MISLPGRATRLTEITARFAGWFALYVALGGLLGFVLARNAVPWHLLGSGLDSKPTCMPELNLLGTIESRCTLPVVNWFWFLLLGLPRVFILSAVIAVVLTLEEFGPSPDPSDPDLIAICGAITLVSASFAWLALLHWRRRAPRAVMAVAATIAIDIALYCEFILP